jgi:hypothetical protein
MYPSRPGVEGGITEPEEVEEVQDGGIADVFTGKAARESWAIGRLAKRSTSERARRFDAAPDLAFKVLPPHLRRKRGEASRKSGPFSGWLAHLADAGTAS